MEREVLIPSDELQMRIKELGARISRDYQGQEPVFVGILNGVVFFFVDLLKTVTVPYRIDFVRAASYGASSSSAGAVRLTKDLELDIAGKPVIVVEDIVDTGLTLDLIIREFQKRGAGSVRVCALIDKLERKVIEVPIDYCGFQVEEGFSVENPYLVSAREPSSPISEEYKKLKSFILKITQSEKFLNTIMVSSGVKGEGKTITALNLAITLAEEYDHSVLLVDADLRQPSVHKYLGIENRTGLGDCLMNGASINDAIVTMGIGKLAVMTAGSEISNPVEILSSNRMKDLTKQLKEQVPDRYVIFDTPPLLPFAESHAIASSVDGILLIVRDGFTSLNNLKETLNIVRDRKILGIVYNDVEIDRFDGYHYYHYYKSYYSDKTKGDNNGNEGKSGLLRSLKRRKP